MSAGVFLVGLLVLIVVLGVVGMVVAGAIGVGLGAKDITDRAAAEKNAGTILDAVFDGSQHVVFVVTPRTLPYGRVLVGARQRGYVLAGQATAPGALTATQLVFYKTDDD